ncbi:zinc finger protein 608 [Denticeps clupeoides]|uniref:C2H2-type domain-containing protein n=1 Tax=Denticeps clupeoides TaxID=299321 RepID=A0AAY4CZ49_9TELE|nr:zinc finger protein 608-like [Denticeps clupeoides]
MSVIPSAEERVRASGADAGDSGDDWEIGLGNLIVHLDAELERDRRKLEMNRVPGVRRRPEDAAFGCAAAALGGLSASASAQPSAAAEPRKFKVKRSGERLPKVCMGKRAQGRPGEAPERTRHPCAKGGEEKRGRRKEKPSPDAAWETGDGRAIVVGKIEESPRTLHVATRSIGTNTQEAGKACDAGSAGPCQPGTSVNLEGIVWHETEEGVLVVNVTWRKRTYVGTLLDCTKHDWAPPRFCESPTSDAEMQGGRGRSKRMRLNIPGQPLVDPVLPKVRGLPHKRRGVAIGGKGRRGSLNLINNCRTPPFCPEDDLKSSPLAYGKRKNKVPADLDLSLITEDIKNDNGKRVRGKSRSAPSTPQGKSDPVFLDQVCHAPMLIDCPHPNCNKKYKHINGLRYHQSHAHLDADGKHDFDVENEDRLSEEEDVTFACSETNSSASKKASSVPKLGALGSSKSKRFMLNSIPSPVIASKVRKHPLSKEGPIDDLSNLPIISNMTVVLENCLITDRNSMVEMPKLEAEDVIDKRDIDDPGKKDNNKLDRYSSKPKSRFIVAPPKLIAIPTSEFSANSTDGSCHQPSLTVALRKTKGLPLKPIKPKLDIIVQPSLANTTLVISKDGKRKEKQRLKERLPKDTRGPKVDNVHIKLEDKGMGKDFSISLLKEHLSKQEVASGPGESQESRMASIRAEADKVYTFTDNAPSPSIGSCSRLDSGIPNGDSSAAKTNSPAYSDISDAADDGGSESRSASRSKTNAAPEANPGAPSTKLTSTPPKEVQSSQLYYHGYEPYCLQGYMHVGQPNATFLKISAAYDGKAKKDELKEGSEEKKIPDSAQTRKKEVVNSQLQLAMSQTQTALAQSLYYGQYARSTGADHKPPAEPCGDEGKRRGQQGAQEPEPKDDVPSRGAGKAGHAYVEPEKQPQVRPAKEQRLESDEFVSGTDVSVQCHVDSNVSCLNDCESHCWSRPFPGKYANQQSKEVCKVFTELHADRSKRPEVTSELEGKTGAGPPSNNNGQDAAGTEQEESGGDKDEDVAADLAGESKDASPPASPQQPYIHYQHSYPYLHLCEPSNNSYRVVSPALVHNYTGFHYPLFGKTVGREDSDLSQTSICSVNSKPPGERSSPECRRDSEQDFSQHLHTHHHTHLGMGYTLLSGQYDPYQGLSPAALVSNQKTHGASNESDGKM